MVTSVGASGTRYQFQINAIGTPYFPRPGVYMFVKRASNGNWDVVYIGETSSFERRLYQDLHLHHQWPGIQAHGATHILTLHVQGGILATREAIETDLRRNHVTPCNQQ